MTVARALVEFCLFMAGCACVYYLLTIVAALRFRATPEAPAGFTPPVSVFKPLRGLERNFYNLLARFCRQDYPEYELLFGVADSQDPAVEVVRRLQQDFPHVPIRLLVADRRYGTNRKVDSLDRMYREMRHGFLAISDGDMRVPPDYLRRIMAPLRDPKVGLVTCLYRGEHGGTWASIFEAVGLTGEFQTSALTARMVEGVKFAFGSTVATRKELVESMGGFPAIANLSDDYEMGSRVAALGYQVVISPCVLDTVLPADTWRTMLQRQFRWACCTAACRPLGHAGLILTHGFPFVLAALALAPRSAIVWAFAAGWLALRLAVAWVGGGVVLQDSTLKRYLFLVPARDLLSFGLWIATFFSRRTTWRGEPFRIEKGNMRPV